MTTSLVEQIAVNDQLTMHPPCSTLRQYRLELGLTQPRLAMLCLLAEISANHRHQGDFNRLAPSSIEELVYAIASLEVRTPDVTHLSKFERGHQRPWPKAVRTLCCVFSQIYEQPISALELFPELY